MFNDIREVVKDSTDQLASHWNGIQWNVRGYFPIMQQDNSLRSGPPHQSSQASRTHTLYTIIGATFSSIKDGLTISVLIF